MAENIDDTLTLEVVDDYIAEARKLLQDTVSPYRYSDADLVLGLNLALIEGRRVRPDLFLSDFDSVVQSFTSMAGQQVSMEYQFRLAFVYGIASYVMRRDQEDIVDARSDSFDGVFHDMLLGVRPRPIQGALQGGRQK
jgi:hypothetical protein